MIGCGDCGEANEESRHFCASCGAFLEWSASPAPAPGEPEPGAAAAGEPEPGAAAAGEPDAGEPAGEVGATEPSPGGDRAEPGGAEPVAPEEAEREEAERQRAERERRERERERERAQRAAAMAAEPSDTSPEGRADDAARSATQQLPAQPAPESPQPHGDDASSAPQRPSTGESPSQRQPGASEPQQPGYSDPTARPPSEPEPARRRSQQATAPVEEVGPGEMACPTCGTGNPPERLFCRRCGVSLTAPEESGEVASRVPWWRRLLGRRRAAAEPLAAGERPARERGGKRVLGRVLLGLVLLLLVVVAAVVAVAGPWRDTVTGAVEDAWEAAFAEIVAVPAASASASSFEQAAEGHVQDRPPAHTIDGFTNTWWAEGVPGDGVGEVLTVRFDGPTELDHVGFHSGNAEGFTDHPRPREVRLTFSDGSQRRLRLADQPGFQDFEVDVDATESVGIQILSVYPGESDHAATAISEVEFFAAK